jgi:hypothetical protein
MPSARLTGHVDEERVHRETSSSSAGSARGRWRGGGSRRRSRPAPTRSRSRIDGTLSRRPPETQRGGHRSVAAPHTQEHGLRMLRAVVAVAQSEAVPGRRPRRGRAGRPPRPPSDRRWAGCVKLLTSVPGGRATEEARAVADGQDGAVGAARTGRRHRCCAARSSRRCPLQAAPTATPFSPAELGGRRVEPEKAPVPSRHGRSRRRRGPAR